MERRTLLKTTVAAGAGAMGLVFGSGAFTQSEVDREFSLQIQDDESALLGVEPSGVGEESQVVTVPDGEKGTLQFNTNDFSLNTAATITIGRFDTVDIDEPGSFEEEAFIIQNNTQQAIDITVDLSGEREVESDARVKFVLSEDDPADNGGINVSETTTIEDGGSGTITDVPADGSDKLFGGVLIETNGAENIDTEIRIGAERSDLT